MKTLTVFQPYALLIVDGIKPVENRTWSTNYRGPLWIHAGTRLHDHPIQEIERKHRVRIDRNRLNFGGIIGRVELVDVVTEHSSPWFHGPFGFILTRPRVVRFTPLRGMPGMFEGPDALK